MFTSLFAGLTLQRLLARVIVLMTAIPVHEAAHAWAADKMGDPTARYYKRISLNPLDHIDPIGAVMILLFGFGFAGRCGQLDAFPRPRQRDYCHQSRGPFSNVLMALVCLVVTKLLLLAYYATGLDALAGVFGVFSYMVSVNLSLAVFNLIPLPPLDGYHAICPLLPRELYWKIQPYEQQMLWLIIILIGLGAFDGIIGFFVALLYRVIDAMTLFSGLTERKGTMIQPSFRLSEFEGPLDLLLHLIAKHKLDILDIEISELLRQYLAFIENRADQDLEVASEFLEMAARLVHIKTVMLLPRHEEEADDLKAKLTGELMGIPALQAGGFRAAAAGAGASGFHPQARRYSGGYGLPPEPSRFTAARSCGRGYRTGGAPGGRFLRRPFRESSAAGLSRSGRGLST